MRSLQNICKVDKFSGLEQVRHICI